MQCKSDYEQKFMKRIKKRVNIDQFLNSKQTRKLWSFIDILVFLLGLFLLRFMLQYTMDVKIKNDRQ